MYGDQTMSYEAIKTPSLAQSQYNLVQVLVKQERWQEAIESCGQVLELDPVFVPAYQTLGELLHQQEDWESAVKYYQAAIELKPDFAEFHHGLGLALSKLKKWEEAARALDKATELNPHFSWSYNSLGEALLRLHRWEKAVEALRKAIELNPDFAWSYFNLGEALCELRDWDGAIFAFQKAMELEKELPCIERKLGDVLYRQSHRYTEEALQLYRRAIAKDPSDFNVYHKLLEVEPGNVEWYFKLGEALESQGELEQALVFYDIALQKNPEAWEKAMEAYSRIMGVHPDSGFIKEKLSKTYTSLAKFSLQKALANYRLAIEFDQDNLELYSQAIAINSQDPQLHLGLAKALMRKGEHPSVIAVDSKEVNKSLYHPQKIVNEVNSQTDSSIEEFDWQLYLEFNPDLNNLTSYEEAYEHWLNHGQLEGRLALESQFYNLHDLKSSDLPLDFDWQGYIKLNLDLQDKVKTKWQAIKHYLSHGIKEERIYTLEQRKFRSQVAEKSIPREHSESIKSETIRLAVLVHVYYYDLWPELRNYLNNIEQDFDLFVNIVESVWQPNIHEGIRRDFPEARILVTKNRGKDVGGQLASMGHLDFDKYDLFCLIHTKKSPHISPVVSNQWRNDLISALLGSKDKVKTNLEIMRRDAKIGVLGSRYWRNTEVSNNSANYYKLLDEFAIKPEARECEYVAGTMMFVRPQVMKPIYEKFGNVELEDGDNKDLKFHMDGQIAHSLERIIGNLVKQQNLEFFWQD